MFSYTNLYVATLNSFLCHITALKFKNILIIMVKDERVPIPPPHWLTNQRAGGGFLKVSCAQVHVSRLPVHTLVVTLHLLCRCDNDGEHRAAAGPGRCWCCSADPEPGLDPVNGGPVLSFSMNISSSRKRVTRTEGAASP